METQLTYSYTNPITGGEASGPVTLGFGPEESNHLDDAQFDELRFTGTLEAWFEPTNQMAMWLILSSRGLRADAATPGRITIEPVGAPGPGQVLRIQARLRQRNDFQAFSLALISHLTFEGGRYL
ncbi:hypothetical protein [Hymenobacter convexus]|uniref:hypothetical protein n=1 Tax=Hymenobacter sp. CA1UV-4 TaxID=3063782 RepID=UPI0027135D0E|nr:hypothetical protein [Hymenobacter sp. CA1UV-4]MDO7854438.1 hypothetical protein [Hymenobacter sp. CA1UV-4]